MGQASMDHADFGRYLSQQRELRGMSREEVSRATKIPPTLVTALELGQVERLPARVFVLNYIRAYAQVIGLSADEAVLRFEEIDKAALSEPPPVLERQRKKQALMKLGLLVVVLAVAGYLGAVLLGHLPPPWEAR